MLEQFSSVLWLFLTIIWFFDMFENTYITYIRSERFFIPSMIISNHECVKIIDNFETISSVLRSVITTKFWNKITYNIMNHTMQRRLKCGWWYRSHDHCQCFNEYYFCIHPAYYVCESVVYTTTQKLTYLPPPPPTHTHPPYMHSLPNLIAGRILLSRHRLLDSTPKRLHSLYEYTCPSSIRNARTKKHMARHSCRI